MGRDSGWMWYHYIGISDLIIWVAVVQLIIVICICIVLRNFKHAIDEIQENVFLDQEVEK